MPPTILTRYLYNKANVIVSFEQSILANEYESALFWGYELYFSGFQSNSINILFDIYENIYSKNHPKLGVFIKRKWQESSGNDDTVLATIIKNVSMKNPDTIEQTNIFCIVPEIEIAKYRTIEPNTNSREPIWKFLRTVCEKQVFCETLTKKKSAQLLTIFRENEKWLFAASGSPIWKTRILKFGGKIDKRKKVVTFTEEMQEAFYDTFNYEPDEQPLIIQKKCLGIL